MLKKLTIGVIWVLLFATVVFPAAAAERVTSFKSRITVNTDGSVDVTDLISVNVEHKAIRLGLILDFFPYRDDEATGKRIKTNYEFKSVKRDGKSENYWTKRKNGKIQLFLGAYEDKTSNYIPTGVNTYEIKYRISNMVSFFTEEDGFYYNLTGNDWDFPIDKVSAEIVLPKGAIINNYIGYTGKIYAKGNDYVAEVKDEDRVYFETTRSLNVKEGFTVSVSFAKGFIDREKAGSSISEYDDWDELPFGLGDWEKDGFAFKWRLNNPLFWSLIIPVIVFLYYFVVWSLYGRDLPKETVVPTYIPPKDISPVVAAGLLDFFTSSEKKITSTLISLINKKYLSLNTEGEKYKIALEKEKTGSYPDLTDDEKAFFEGLYIKSDIITKGIRDIRTVKFLGADWEINPQDEVKVKDNDAKNISLDTDAKCIYRSYLRMQSACSEIFKKYIVKNYKYRVLGILLTLGVFAVEAFFSLPVIIPVIFLLPVIAIICVIWSVLRTIIGLNKKGKEAWLARIFLCFFFIFWVVPFLGSLGVGLYMLYESSSGNLESLPSNIIFGAVCVIGSCIFTILTNCVFFFLLKKKTREGEKAVAAVKGLYDFIDKVEKDRYTKITPDIFERNLAYAVIFGIEEKWVERFKVDCRDAQVPSYYRHISSSSFHKAIYKSLPVSHSHSHSSRGGGHSGGGGGHGGGHGR